MTFNLTLLRLGLCFVVYGAAKCHWTETHSTTSGSGRSRTTRTNTVHYKGKDVYLNTRTYLFGRDGGDSIEIASGTYKYDFAVQLPPQLPFSFEGAHGSIRYYVEACLDIPWDFDEEIKKPFTVVRIDDLNLNRELKVPVNCEDVKTFCCLFCESEPLVMNATIPCTGFIPGQNILIKVKYVNKSDQDIDHTRFSLKRIIHFNSTSPRSKTRTDSDKMAEVFGPGIRPGATISFDKILNVPQIAVNSNNLLCNVVQIYYQLTIEASVPGCHGNIEFNIPITIGTIPLDLAPAATAPPPAPSTQPTIIATAPPTFDSFPNAPSPKAPLLAPEDIRKHLVLFRDFVKI